MLIFDIIKKFIINIITPPRAGNISKLVKSPNEPLEEPLIESKDSLQENIVDNADEKN